MTTITGWIAWKPCACGPWEAVGSRRSRARKGRSLPGNLRTSRCFPPITFRSPEDEIKNLESVLTIVGGKPVYAAEEFAELAPPLPPVLPEWSPVAAYGGYHKAGDCAGGRVLISIMRIAANIGATSAKSAAGFGCLCWAF